jgi:hypothetical protein
MAAKKVRHTKANYDSTSEGCTVYTSEVRDFIGPDEVNVGDDFVFIYKNGSKRFGTASREGTTIYFSKKNFLGMGRSPSRNKPVYLEVAAIVRL